LIAQASLVDWATPKGSVDLRKAASLFQRLPHTGMATQRQLFRNLVKGFEVKEVELASTQQKVHILEAQLEKKQPRKRKKVAVSPNSKFVTIREVNKVQELADRLNTLDLVSSDEGDASSELSCIEVKIS
jgi:BMFP domain-containing protein YqiC